MFGGHIFTAILMLNVYTFPIIPVCAIQTDLRSSILIAKFYPTGLLLLQVRLIQMVSTEDI